MALVGLSAPNQWMWARLDLATEKAELFALQQNWARMRAEID